MKTGIIIALWIAAVVATGCAELAVYNECRTHGFSVFYCLSRG
jgi:hypothetical protein